MAPNLKSNHFLCGPLMEKNGMAKITTITPHPVNSSGRSIRCSECPAELAMGVVITNQSSPRRTAASAIIHCFLLTSSLLSAVEAHSSLLSQRPRTEPPPTRDVNRAAGLIAPTPSSSDDDQNVNHKSPRLREIQTAIFSAMKTTKIIMSLQ